jgi:hypothetical protein
MNNCPIHTEKQEDCENCRESKRDWIEFGCYLIGVGSCFSFAGGSFLKGSALYCAIVFVTMGRDSIHAKYHRRKP